MVVDSVRIDENTIELSLLSEIFLCRLLGQSMLYTHGRNRQKDWQKIILKIVKVMERAIRQNITTDDFHISQLNLLIVRLKKAGNSKEITDIDIILSLTGIIFELLGGLPDYSRRKVVNRKDDYYLNGLRRLLYAQTPTQKMRTILEASRYIPYCHTCSYDDLFEVYASRFSGDPEGFVKWYKEEYPEIYLKLF